MRPEAFRNDFGAGWAGRAADPSYFDLSLLEPVSSSGASGTALDLSAWHPEKAENTFADTSIASIVLQVPHGYAGLSAGTRITVWAATKLADGTGGWRQINRGGLPMMWPIFWPEETDFANPANSRHPSQDVADREAFARMITAALLVAKTTGLVDVSTATFFVFMVCYLLATPLAVVSVIASRKRTNQR